MAEITDEITALRDLVADVGFTKIRLAHLPDKYTAGELSIRYQGDDVTSETGYHYRLDREYQFVFFGTSERDVISYASKVQRRLNSVFKLKIGTADESGYMTLGSFSCSQPFKAEDNVSIYGIIGVLQAEVREARYFTQSPKISGIETDVTEN
ncbi:hypothetical protein [Sporosarcina phage Lietuvens]|nr:hypothetical protein [Sporosarcina phage Lietuvens]